MLHIRLTFLAILRTVRPRSVIRLYDAEGRLAGLRAFRHKDMDQHFMADLMLRVDALASGCKVKEPTGAHKRGKFANMRIGWSHGMGENQNVGRCPLFPRSILA